MNYSKLTLDTDMFSEGFIVSGVYFISDSNGHIKIGESNNIARRLHEIQTAIATRCCLIQYLKIEDQDNRRDWEKALHNYFKDYRVKGEWFREQPIIDFIGEENLFTSELLSKLIKPLI